MIRRPPRSTLSSSSAASDVYKRQIFISVCMTFIAVDDDDDVPAKINPHNNKTSTTTHTIPSQNKYNNILTPLSHTDTHPKGLFVSKVGVHRTSLPLDVKQN
eukprot:TRINITY_DN18044_c0_g1_i3.p1 TRINITY_DN18044_c0_g1~~TRINITY_DN18044_c0_g1_i3.p1  ORF type:complete len:102 (+),score=16.16 TRINITY_DN18044_c0_g1_i3:150-455(+)